MYFYEDHLGGGVYTTFYEKDYDELYCEECGDSDTYLGEWDSWEDFISQLDPENDWIFYTINDLATWSELPVERVLELNPNLKSLRDFYVGEDSGEDSE